MPAQSGTLSKVERIRRDVEVALTCQPDEPCAALDGDGHTVVNLSFFEGKVSPEWLPDIEADLVWEFNDILYDKNGVLLPSVRGVSLLDFHEWTGRLVKRCDPQFSWEDKIGKGSRARSIQGALVDWVRTAPSGEAEDECGGARDERQ